MQKKIQRSMLILPVNVSKFVEKAHTRGADAIVLDLEDAVPIAEKQAARLLVKDSIKLAGKSGSDVLVRINNDDDMIRQDLEASVMDGLSAIFFPKVERPEQIVELESKISQLERDNSLAPGTVKISVHVEGPLGILNLKHIAASGARIESISLGVDDYSLQMGIRLSDTANELLFPLATIATVSRAFGLTPLGVAGSVAEFSDLEKFRKSAYQARNLGFSGAYCIHPLQVAILNDVFSPSPDEIIWAKSVVECFEEALGNGRASTSLNGKMIDTPVYKQALAALQMAESIYG